MLIASGTTLVLVTWAACAVALVSLGLLPALTVARRPTGGQRANAAPVMRYAIWWGLVVATLFAYLINVVQPLHGGTTAAAGLALLTILGIPGWWRLARRRRWQRSFSHSWPFTLLWLALAASLVYLAAAALGPVTNYDSGLYHLGAIKYASWYSTIPGLANLYFPLGYGNAEFPLAALLGNGPWQGEGYRLLNGLIMSLAVLDLGLRSHERRLGPGFFVLAAGVLAAWVPLVALSDYWVTSPTQDSSVFVVTVVASAYLADTARGGRRWMADAGMAAVLGILLVLLRPTMAAFAAATVTLALLLAWRRRRQIDGRQFALVGALVAPTALIAAAAATTRDYLLSGWVQYPLSVHAFDVEWLAADPAQYRVATLGYHRNPADLWNSVEGWQWVGPWLVSRVTQWETYELAGLVVVALIITHLADRAARPHARWGAMLVALVPSAVATAAWWLATPPSYRFAWGVIFTLATIPIGWALWLLAERPTSRRIQPKTWRTLMLVCVSGPIMLVTAYSAIARFDVTAITQAREWRLGISIPYAVAPVVDVPVRTVTTGSGLALTRPTTSDQCWDHFPMCTPEPNTNLRLRGADLSAGLLP